MTGPEETKIVYTLDLFANPITGQMKAKQRYRFSLTIIGDDITGVVEELSVPVTGKNHVMGGALDVHRITLEFPWDRSHIFLEGFTFLESGGRREFVGRFDAGEPVSARPPGDGGDVQLLRGPDPGDVGTGTGQQT